MKRSVNLCSFVNDCLKYNTAHLPTSKIFLVKMISDNIFLNVGIPAYRSIHLISTEEIFALNSE